MSLSQEWGIERNKIVNWPKNLEKKSKSKMDHWQPLMGRQNILFGEEEMDNGSCLCED